MYCHRFSAYQGLFKDADILFFSVKTPPLCPSCVFLFLPFPSLLFVYCLSSLLTSVAKADAVAMEFSSVDCPTFDAAVQVGGRDRNITALKREEGKRLIGNDM
jgi:hypothetical protein